MSFIYVASPYSHNDRAVVNARHHLVLHYTTYLFHQKKLAFSPIVHCHPLAQHGGLPGDFLFWEQYNRAMISCCDLMHVLELPGVEVSKGVQAEISIAYKLDIPIEYISMKTLLHHIHMPQEGDEEKWPTYEAYKLLVGTTEF